MLLVRLLQVGLLCRFDVDVNSLLAPTPMHEC
jgi:hypothetical protein